MVKLNKIGLIVFLFLLFVAGCHHSDKDASLDSSFHGLRESPPFHMKEVPREQDGIVPIEVADPFSLSVIGWMSNGDVLLNESRDGVSVISQYHIFSGKKTERIKLDLPVTSAEISPNREFLLLHTSPNPYEADLQIFRTDTFQEVYKESFESSEIAYVWNGNDETKLLITAFYEDWSYKTYIIDTSKKESESVELPQPFAEWLDEKRMLMLDWDMENPDILAHLIVSSKTETEKIEGEEYYFIKSWPGLVLAVGVSSEDFGVAEYIFFNQHLKPIFSFQVPHISQYSGWMVPYFDYLEESKDFLMIEPKESGEIGLYEGGFQLTKRNMETGEKTMIAESIENEPFTCSPNGQYCLLGFSSDEILFLEDGRIEPFLIEKQ